MKTNRDNFASSFGVLVAMAGSAIGLGNLWRFPYLVGTSGGAAFIIVYLLMVFLLCLPILIAEFIVGRKSQANVFRAFKVIKPKGQWGIIGIISVLSAICILAFYSVVGGWTIDYMVKAITFNLNVSGTSATEMFTGITTSSWQPLVYMLIFMVLTGIIIFGGIKNGIEKFSKVMMPVLFLMILVIAVRSLTLPGASEGVEFLFKPDFSKITSETLLAALGQAFFSLSIGCGTILTYASYVKKSDNMIKTASLTAISDTTFALIAGTAIMPAVFAFGVSPSEGPGLVFIVLPEIFAQIPAGSVMAIIFFFVLLIAALTSSISLLEVAVTFLIEEFNMKRKVATIISMAVCVALGTLSSLSQGVLADVSIFGLNIFDTFDFLSANILMPISGLLMVFFVGWIMEKPAVLAEMSNEGTLKINVRIYKFIYFIIRFVAPFVILTVMLFGLLS